MSPDAPIPDDEIVLRHVPGGPAWQAPPDFRLTSMNFRLRPGESGLSVSRQSVTSPADLLARLGDPATGSRVAAARVGDLRALGFGVVSVPRADDPGHAEVRPVTADPASRDVRRALALAFRYIA